MVKPGCGRKAWLLGKVGATCRPESTYEVQRDTAPSGKGWSPDQDTAGRIQVATRAGLPQLPIPDGEISVGVGHGGRLAREKNRKLHKICEESCPVGLETDRPVMQCE